MGYIAKNFFYQGIMLSLNTQYLLNKSERLQQGVLYPNQMQNWMLNPKINATIKRKANVSYEAIFSNTQMKILSPVHEKIKNSFNEISQKFKGHYFFSKSIEFNTQAEYLHNEIAKGIHSKLTFVDLGVSYKHKNFNFTLNWNNILNQKDYAYTVYGGLDVYQYSYRLRPQSVLASIVFKY
jgi:hypothetical protein